LPQTQPPAALNRPAPSLDALGLSRERPLVLVDVDEVLGLFMQGFGDFLAGRGLEMRIDRFALFQNIYRPGEPQHLDLQEGKALFDAFFASHCHEIEPAPGAVAALNRLAAHAEILILSNAPAQAERLRAQWLASHGLKHPLILNTGPKGPIAASLTRQTPHRTAFVDDLLPNLDSVADHSPGTTTFQHVADERLRPLAPASERHRRIDDWAELAEAIEAALRR
jgi:Predicted hydrolase (HAD superfamily)